MNERRSSSGEDRREEKEKERDGVGDGGGVRIGGTDTQGKETDSGMGQESSRLMSNRKGERGDVDERVRLRVEEV